MDGVRVNDETPPRRPVIGIKLPPPLPPELHYLKLKQSYAEAVLAAGGSPILLPPVYDEGLLRQTVSTLDGILWPGGAHRGWEMVELQILRWNVAERLPTLAICRGHQMLNLALGGAVSSVADRGRHLQTGAWSELSHPIEVAPDSRLAEILGATSLQVNSFHEWSVDRVASEVRAVAWAPDGVVEAVESVDHPWLVGVQFHPEDLVGHHEPSRRLFRAFVQACQRRRLELAGEGGRFRSTAWQRADPQLP